MLIMETLSKIRRLYYVEKKGFKTIARELRLSKNTVKKVIRENKTIPRYHRSEQPYRVLEKYVEGLRSRLAFDQEEPRRRRRTAMKLYLELCEEGYTGSYVSVNNFVKHWKLECGQNVSKVYVPLEFAPGEAFQFDWSEEEIALAGKLTRIKVAHIRLSHSRFFLTVAYPNEQLEMVLEAHDEAFLFFGGVCRKGIYDNMKTAVQKVLVGKDRIFNRRFLELASHYLFEPIACTPAAGWEKGQVENQVSTSRCRFFTPLCHVDSLDELNEHLKERCVQWAKNQPHPEQKDKSVWEVYQAEKPHLLPYRDAFNVCKLVSTRVSSYSLVNFDTNAYSVDCCYVGKAVELRIYAKRIVIYYGEKEIGSHIRHFGRHQRIYDPWHYVPVLERKPGALRNGAPFKDFKLPKSTMKVQTALANYSDGDKQFIKLLLQVKKIGLASLEKACTWALAQGSCQADMILDHIKNPKQKTLSPDPLSDRLKLVAIPDANCKAYDTLFLSQTLRNIDAQKREALL